MKTCTNPKCKTTGIPDDANFCPLCGKQLTKGNWVVVNLSIKKESVANNPDEVHTTVKSQFIFGDKGKLMKDGYFKIDLRQVEGKVPGFSIYNMPHAQYSWSVITGEHPVKAYVAEDEKFEVVFDKNGRITELNFYPEGKFKTKDVEEAYSSIMCIPFGNIRREKTGWWKVEEYYEWGQLRAQYAQYGIKNMTAEQWWKEHDLECLRYLNKYQDVITQHLGVDIVQQKIWEHWD